MGLARGLRQHYNNIKVIAADPHGSILAEPSQLNEQHDGKPYHVEGIGYDFVPQVLDRREVDVWCKTDDRESFYWARSLIREEGLLVGGSSGAAMAACKKAAETMHFGRFDIMVVILPDGIRSYLSKFANRDWLEANDLVTAK